MDVLPELTAGTWGLSHVFFEFVPLLHLRFALPLLLGLPLLILPRWGCPGPCTACPAQPGLGLGLGLGAGSTVRTTATRGEPRNGTRLLFATPGTLKYEKRCPCAFCHFGQGGKMHSAFQWKLFQRIWHAVFLKGSQNGANPLISTLV